MKKINEHNLSVKISKLEGKKVEVNIAQIKEVLKYSLHLISQYNHDQLLDMIEKHRRIVIREAKRNRQLREMADRIVRDNP